MSQVRRCDNPLCTNGPASTVNVSENANPDGWLAASSAALVGGQPSPLDFCTPLCAAQGLYGGQVDVAPAGTLTKAQRTAIGLPTGSQKT